MTCPMNDTSLRINCPPPPPGTYYVGQPVTIRRPGSRHNGHRGIVHRIEPDHAEAGDGDLLIVATNSGRRVPCFAAEVETREAR